MQTLIQTKTLRIVFVVVKFRKYIHLYVQIPRDNQQNNAQNHKLYFLILKKSQKFNRFFN